MAQVPVQREPQQKQPRDGHPPKKGGEQQAAPLTRHEITELWRHPFDAMRHALGWDPFERMMSLRPWKWEPRLYIPDFDVKETDAAFIFKADVPGIDAQEIDVKLSANRLTVSGHREEEKSKKGETYYAYERSYGSFSRSFNLPAGVDAERIDADVKDGVLTISAAKKPQAETKQVSVKRS